MGDVSNRAYSEDALPNNTITPVPDYKGSLFELVSFAEIIMFSENFRWHFSSTSEVQHIKQSGLIGSNGTNYLP